MSNNFTDDYAININGADDIEDDEKDQGRENTLSQVDVQQMMLKYQQEYSQAKESSQSWIEHCK